jgi:dTDP-4-dehydrorhamnose reductase
MPISKIILFGKTGMLGTYIYSYFSKIPKYQVIPITSAEFRVSEESLHTLENLLVSKQIDEHTCVINCIGMIPQRVSNNTNNKEYFIVNGMFPKILSTICNRYNAKCILPTTDCVYSGKKGGYIETDKPDETNDYGRSKAFGEPNDANVIRTSIIGKELRNKKSFMEFVLNSEGEINGWDNHMWNGITCLEYAKVIEKIIERNLFWDNGVKHIYSPKSMSKYEMADTIRDVFGLNLKINKIEAKEKCDKTLKSMYDLSEKLEIKDLKEQIAELKEFELVE